MKKPWMDPGRCREARNTLRGKRRALRNAVDFGLNDLDLSIQVLELQQPKQVRAKVKDKDIAWACPTCEKIIAIEYKDSPLSQIGYIGNYCPWCGQRLKK